MYDPAMTYPLAVMTVDEEERECIQTPVLPIIVQKLGLNRNLPVAIRHGPKRTGRSRPHRSSHRAWHQTSEILCNVIQSKSAAGGLILATLKHLQQEAGVGEALLEVPMLHIPYLMPTIRQYMSNHTLTMTFTDALTLSIH